MFEDKSLRTAEKIAQSPHEVVTKAVILAGGLGTRLMEETVARPKPMVEIGGMPILWHIMRGYHSHGIRDFIVCLGYKGHMIKEWFNNYRMHAADVTFDLAENTVTFHRTAVEPWKVTLVETGLGTMTGGRLRRVRDHVGDRPFCFTYGDAVSTVDVRAAIAFHLAHGKAATVTGVVPQARFGALDLDSTVVRGFREKPAGDGQLINGGFFVLQPSVIDLIAGDSTRWEAEPMEQLARTGELMAYRHDGFWQPMDTLREKRLLEELWDTGRPPWMSRK